MIVGPFLQLLGDLVIEGDDLAIFNCVDYFIIFICPFDLLKDFCDHVIEFFPEGINGSKGRFQINCQIRILNTFYGINDCKLIDRKVWIACIGNMCGLRPMDLCRVFL